MEYQELSIKGCWLLTPRRFGDSRGYFAETYNKADFDKHVGAVDFVQDNESVSSLGVLRGLHFQRGEWSQAKLVRVIEGKVLDVAVDLRKDSPTFGKHIAVTLDDSEGKMLYIPRGFAHGFLVMSNRARFQYKVDNFYAPSAEVSLRYDDPVIGIKWPDEGMTLNLSPKDLSAISFEQLKAESLTF